MLLRVGGCTGNDGKKERHSPCMLHFPSPQPPIYQPAFKAEQVFSAGESAIYMLNCLVFAGKGKPEVNPQSKAKTRNKFNPRMLPGRNQTWAAMVGSEGSHHCAIIAS